MKSRNIASMALWIATILGCEACERTDQPGDAGEEVRDRFEIPDQAEVEEEIQEEALNDVPAETAEDPCGPDRCPNDPPDGPVGLPCVHDRDCQAGLECRRQDIEERVGEEYVTFLDGYCWDIGVGGDACDPDIPETCPEGSVCISLGVSPYTGEIVRACLDRCAPVSRDRRPWPNNCDCRDGYECDLRLGVCFPGCNPANERECCEVWRDGHGGAPRDGWQQPQEIVLLGPDRCTNTCDPCTYSCINRGCPDGQCAIGDPCEHDSDCPPDSYCISEQRACPDPHEYCPFPGGVCFKARCDLVGRECPDDGSACLDLGNGDDPNMLCVMPCTPGTQPGDPGYPCRDAGEPGPGPGDYVCFPIFEDPPPWEDEDVQATGFCYFAGNFPGGSTMLGGACREDTECNSPFGLGTCFGLAGTPPACSAFCNREATQAGICETDEATGAATGMCAFGLCWETCENPNAPLGAANTGCTLDSMACLPAQPVLDNQVGFYDTDETAPAGFCFPACTSDAWCTRVFGRRGQRVTCNRETGICDIFQ